MAKSLSLIPIVLLCCLCYLQGQTLACNMTCGNITFHYPFTISGRNCNGLPGFEINCPTVAQKPLFGKANTPYYLPITPHALEIVEFSYNNIRVVSNQLFAFPDSYKILDIDKNSSFEISDNNTFVAMGCSLIAVIDLYDGEESTPFTAWLRLLSTPWRTENLSSKRRLPCKESGCSSIPIRAGFYKFNLSVSNRVYRSRRKLLPVSNPICTNSGAAVVDKQSWESIKNSKSTNLADALYTMSLVWAIQSSVNCSIIKNISSYACSQEAECEDQRYGYVCKCPQGFKGDGYINGTGCTASCSITNSSFYKCAEEAVCEDRKFGYGYDCKCRKGYAGDGYIPIFNGTRYINGTGCKLHDKCSSGAGCKFQTLSAIIGECAFGSFVVALLGGGALLWALKRRNLKLAKRRNYEKNGGAEVEKILSSLGEKLGVERPRLFTEDEINKATNNFSESLVLGTGGYGTVYKGTLNDGTFVAVKKPREIDSKKIDSKTTDSKKPDSKKVDSKEIDSKEGNQLTNEVAILSQIKHKNVVKLLGCCLETPVPLMVFEYISNGTLFELLHSDKYEDHPLGWEDRLRIATETAEALSYLHLSATSMPVVHRDVKSSNILLDDAYNPKVADFGVSRLVPKGQSHVTTALQGTAGYMDPEYYRTVQLTEKSDVYSFGVVLVELLTGLKPVSDERIKNQSNLAIFFLSTLESNGLIGIIDPRLKVEESGNMESMERVANLAKECLTVEGEKRPTMKEVFEELLCTKNGERPYSRVDVYAAEIEERVTKPKGA